MVSKIKYTMYSLYTVKHGDISVAYMERAIALKSVAWPYPKESQLQWMRTNLKPEDIHVFLQEDGEDVAYLNIAMVNAIINGISTTCAGIGNVCSIRRGCGKELILRVNNFINNLNVPGILFCKDTLVGFYNQYNWKLLNPEHITLDLLIGDINTMVFNLEIDSFLIYNDRNF